VYRRSADDSIWHGVDFKGKEWGVPGWDWIQFGSNNHKPENGRPMAVDYDDMAVSTQGRIGPVGTQPQSTPGR